MREYINNRIDSLAEAQGFCHEGIDNDVVDNTYRSTFLISKKGEYEGLFLEVSQNTAQLIDYKPQYGRESEKELVLIANFGEFPPELQLFSVKIQELLGFYGETNEFLTEFHRKLGDLKSNLRSYFVDLTEIEGEIDNA